MTVVLSVFDQAAVGLAVVGVDGQFLKINDCMADELRRDRNKVLNFRFQDITHPDDLPVNMANVERMMRGEIDRFQAEKRYFDEQGDPFWTQLNVSLVRGVDGTPQYFLSVVQDIEDRRRRETQLRSLAFRDVLTGLTNRAGFELQAPGFIETARRRNLGCGLIVVDMNRLKAVNDCWGHATGDLLISTVGQRLQKALGDSGFAARLGGDEFAALVAPVRPGLLEDVRRAIERPFVHQSLEMPVSVSAGMAVCGMDGNSLFSLLRAADNRMYQEKKRFHGALPWNPDMYWPA